MEFVTLFKLVEVLVDSGGCTLQFLTDLPGNALAVRSQAAIPATAGRHPFRLVLPGSVKGKLYQLKIIPGSSSTASIYAAKVYARPLGPPTLAWAWYGVQGIFATQDDWSEYKLPIEPTSDTFSSIKLPIDETPDVYTTLRLPIDPTAETFTSMTLPIKGTPVVPEWVTLPVDE